MTDTPNTFAAGFVAGRDAAAEIARTDYMRNSDHHAVPACRRITAAISALTPPEPVEAAGDEAGLPYGLVPLLVREGRHSGVWFAHRLIEAAKTLTQQHAALTAASEREKKMREAYDTAVAFIESHVADPDITSEMVERYAEYRRARAALNQTEAVNVSTPTDGDA